VDIAKTVDAQKKTRNKERSARQTNEANDARIKGLRAHTEREREREREREMNTDLKVRRVSRGRSRTGRLLRLGSGGFGLLGDLSIIGLGFTGALGGGSEGGTDVCSSHSASEGRRGRTCCRASASPQN
jgi:hypothetical protein